MEHIPIVCVEDQEWLLEKVADASEELKQINFEYDVPFLSEIRRKHFVAYTHLARKYNSMIFANFDDIERELRKPKPNVNYCVKVIQKLIESNFHRNLVQNKLNRFIPVTSGGRVLNERLSYAVITIRNGRDVSHER